jgi:predicted  nucleic acid-binding Zn-ribbon protein
LNSAISLAIEAVSQLQGIDFFSCLRAMEFHDYAAQETSALLSQLLASRTEASAQHLRAVREALEAATGALTALPPVEQNIQELVGRLTHAAAEQVRKVGDEAHATVSAVRGELEGQRAENARLAASLAQAESAIGALRTEVQNERERAEAADRDLTLTVEAHTELEAACRQAEAACRNEAQAKAALEQELHDTRELQDLALSDTARLQEQIGRHVAEGSRLEGELAGLRAAHGGLETELSALRAAHGALEAARQAVESDYRNEADARSALAQDLQEARGLLDLALAEAARLGGELEHQTSENVTLRADLANALQDGAERDTLRAQRDSMAMERDAVLTQLEASNGRVHALETSQARHEDTIRQLEVALASARQGEARSREQAVSIEEERTGVRAETERLRGEASRVIALLEQSVRSVDELAGTRTVPDLLSSLVTGLSIEFPRVALFRVKGNCVEGELQVGFEQTTDVTKFVFPLTLDSLLTRVVSSGSVERLTGKALAAHGATPFGGTPAAALALPISLQGEPFAVLYAEDAERSPISQAASVGFAKLLVAETVVLLMRHTHELKTINELRDYAAMLVREAEQMYSADAEAGRTDDELRARLKGNLDCARQLYGHRAELEGSAAAMLLDEQIAVAIEAATPFARDLAALIGRSKEKKQRRKAEAS